ncbi:MAG: hypothetical protein KC505_07630 [Myxococcales bacterium]|nr:hypothetical protein [Myxococcales bacterium]USN51561.1 MAG: hypothetical protein H6731_03900 [Myxococcales bacterium]
MKIVLVLLAACSLNAVNDPSGGQSQASLAPGLRVYNVAQSLEDDHFLMVNANNPGDYRIVDRDIFNIRRVNHRNSNNSQLVPFLPALQAVQPLINNSQAAVNPNNDVQSNVDSDNLSDSDDTMDSDSENEDAEDNFFNLADQE